MAIGNAYRPAWRSRRRSRLSLVERAVPRLGRHTGSDNIPITENSSAPVPSEDSQTLLKGSAVEERQEQSEEHGVDDRPIDHSADTALDEPADMAWPPAEDEIPPSSNPPEGTAEGDSDDDQRPNDIELPTPPATVEDAPADADTAVDSKSPTDRKAELELDQPSSDHNETAEEGEDQPEEARSKDDPASSLTTSFDNDDVDTEDDIDPEDDADDLEALVLPEALQSSWDMSGISAAFETKSDVVELQLDWDKLLPLGLVDPRDRSQPLPGGMEEIARALVRQCMSDQSSWRDRIILVSSARENRAKSMAALNFALALTTIDPHNVVLMDANMAGNGAASCLGAGDHPGVSTALCDSTVEVEDITLKTSLERLTLVSSGAYEDDILDRFASRRMLEILRALTKDPNTLLVLDAPPILTSQEATVLSVIAGQVVLVVEAGATDETSINNALKRIGERHNLSLVLSRHAGIAPDTLPLAENAPSRRLASPQITLPAPRRRLKRAAAYLALGLGFGLSLWLASMLLSSYQINFVNLSNGLPQLISSVEGIKPTAPQIGGVTR